MAHLIKEDGSVTEVFPADAEEGFSLSEIYALLGIQPGFMEMLRCPSGRWMILDEHGKFRERPPNMKATLLAGVYPYDIIVGPVLYCLAGEIK